MIATQGDVQHSKLHVGSDCLQRIGALDVIRPFVLLLRHGVCLLKIIKSVGELVGLKTRNGILSH